MDNQRLDRCNELVGNMARLQEKIDELERSEIDALRRYTTGFKICGVGEAESFKAAMLEVGRAKLNAMKLEFNSL